MEGEECNTDVEAPYPILFIPKVCTPLETHCQVSENVFIRLNISSPDTFGNQTVIYQGFCNVKLLDGNDINIRYGSPDSLTSSDNIPVILTEANQITFPAYNDSQVWIDPARSPYVYNRCDSPPKEAYTMRTYTTTEAHNNHITIEQHNTYITQNVYQYNEAVHYSSVCEEQKAVEKIQENAQNSSGHNMYQEDEFECGVFLSQLSEEIIHEKETRERDERKFIGLQTDNEALKQLMSSDIQSVSRQQKTILFLGHDSESGQTVQNIAINDPSLECRGARAMATEVTVEPDESNTNSTNPRAKKYQCNKCKQIFDQLSAFKQHMVGSHRLSNLYDVSSNVRFMCTDCGKNLKNQEKFEQHCRGHGDPDLECNKCHKVFASKFTLRNHRKIHYRMYPCNFCTKSYSTSQELQSHTSKAHFSFMCECCSFTCENFADLTAHQEIHKSESHSEINNSKNSSESDFAETGGLFEEIGDFSVPEDMVKREQEERLQTADSVIAKVMSNKIFRSNSTSSSKKQRKYNKTCEVCLKKFDRIGDLKRHLIEHVIRSTLAKNPVNKFGVLNIRCEICQEKVFTKIDRYKAHLREHAKLTLYKCTFCDKSFSDSSNFSKHKKIHGTTYFQCDLCQRKFNSKKMITQHMEYHNNTNPIQCQYCDKVFHFESMLNKHIRCSHTKMSTTKFRCRFCRNYFKSLKEKWDHEWTVHNVRKAIVDCLVCGSRFRKYAELKRHCTDEHGTAIPQAKRLLGWKMKRKVQLLDENS